MLPDDPLTTLFFVVTGVEAAVLLVLSALAVLRRPRRRQGSLAWRALGRLGRRRRLSVAVVFGVSFTLCAAVTVVHRPVPRIQDEFSYLLAADTFAHGRLANPTPPLWEHFESEHILMRPTYASKYPPAQGLALALGQALTGWPIVGAWLATAAASAAICWMLQGWLPGRWALLGGLLAAMHPGLVAWWGHSYWGGSVAALGGALMFGAVPRVWRRPRVRESAILGAGVVLLAASRPFEGLMASIPVALSLAALVLGPRRPALDATALRIVLPMLLVLGAGGAWMAYCNERVTGDPLRMPYQVHEEQYGAAPTFLFQSPPVPPHYRDRKLEDFHVGWELGLYKRQRTAQGMAVTAFQKNVMFWAFYVGPPLTVGLAGLALMGRGRTRDRGWLRFASAAVGWSVTATMACVWFHVFYLAPIMGLLVYLALQGMRRVRASGSRGRGLAWAALWAQTAALPAVFVVLPIVDAAPDWSKHRAAIEDHLRATGGRHLIVQRHGGDCRPLQEYIYNSADIESAPVVWARELDSGSVPTLLEHFKDRTVWLMEAFRPGAPLPELVPYPRAPAWLYRPAIHGGGGARIAAVWAVAGSQGSGPVVAYRVAGERGARGLRLVNGELVPVEVGGTTTGPPMAAEVPPALAGRIAKNSPAAAGDLGGDGQEEVAAGNAGRDSVSVYSRRSGEWSGEELHCGVRPTGIVLADIDGDGRRDICVSTFYGHGLTVLRNLGGLNFDAPVEITLGGSTWFADKATCIAAVDLDGDGMEDLVVGTVRGVEVLVSGWARAGEPQE